MAELATTVQKHVTGALLAAIAGKRIEVNNAMTLVAHAMELMDGFQGMSGSEKSSHLLIILEDIAKGPDGEWGTSDDVLSPAVWNGVKALINAGILQATMDLICQIKKGTFPSLTDPEVQQLAAGCFSFIIKAVSPKKSNSTSG